MPLPTEGLVAQGTKAALREKISEDLRNDYDWRVDPELSELDATYPLTLPLEEFAPMYREEARYPTPRSHRFAIIDLEGRHIGNIMYYDLDLRRRETELGIMIGDRGYWSHGYGEDAINLLLDYLFDRLNLRRVYLQTLEWNIRAQKCFMKCGFRQHGSSNRGAYHFMLMEVFRDEWERRRQEREQRATKDADAS